jgi:polyisoprenoid-binding protein YceI
MRRLTLGALALAVPIAVTAAPETYTIDPIHSFPHFAVDHLGVTTIWGRFDRMAGKFTIDRAAKKGGLDLAIDTTSVSTGDADRGARPRSRDDHLRSADFFNVAEFPRMTFKAGDVKFSGDEPTEVSGALTLLGVTKALTLRIERWVCKDHPFSKKPMCGGEASAVLKRTDFGMKYGVPAVGDEIRVVIGFEGYRD